MPLRHYRDRDRRGYLWTVARGSLDARLLRPVRTCEVAVQEQRDGTPTGRGYMASCSEWQTRLEADDAPPTIGPEAWPQVRELVAEALAWPIATDENTPDPGETLVTGEWPAAVQTAMML
ncbi:MAG TPA: hypothetical protein PLG21_20815 [Anaerolineae bacterium]|nr:hypothetical protein [Anaerolineae bacterium]